MTHLARAGRVGLPFAPMSGVASVDRFRVLPSEVERGAVHEVLAFPCARVGVVGRAVGSALLIALAIIGALASRWAASFVLFAVGSLLGLDARALSQDEARQVTVHENGLLIEHASGMMWVRWADIEAAELRLAHTGGVLRFGRHTVVLSGSGGTALVEAIRDQRWLYPAH